MLVGVIVYVRLKAFGVRYPQSTQEQRLALQLEVPIYVRMYVRTCVCMYMVRKFNSRNSRSVSLGC